MAVYAAYRHIELDKIGYGKRRVLKPPGGGSSDIFGMSEAVEQSPRRVHINHHLQSSMFGANGMPESPSVRRTKPGGNPVTGEGHIATAINDQKGSSSPPAVTTTNGTGNAEIRRNRVPPGGYSSGLW